MSKTTQKISSKTVAVLMGGVSAEREVSLVTGKACAEGLREAGYQVTEIDVGRDVAALVDALTPAPDAVFNALHGRWGEDGCVQGILELLRIPYTHSGLLASALAMDKPVAKQLFEAAGLACPEGVVVEVEDLAKGDALPRPYVVKPANEGSSVGVRIIKNGTNLPPVDLDQWPPGTKLMVERFIAGRELTVAVMGDRPLAVTEIRPREGFYDYEAKYTDGRADHVIPAQIPAEIYDRALEMAVTAHKALGCRGVSRADFRYDDTEKAEGDLYLLEINTQPGMTPLSLVPEQAAYLNIPFP
ncbi:MAG: D-alanine--D-alanine ligase, partial [Proteobacteria bacterium]|nr:D-alanine--D-alanine ligase [Pseudomonadota bacterium]